MNVDDTLIANVANAADADPRSVVRRLAGLPVRGRAGARIDRALTEVADYVARDKTVHGGTNEPCRVAGAAFNIEPPPVSVPPGFSSRRVSSGADPHGERLALGMVRAAEFARAAVAGLEGADLDAIATAAVQGFVRGFASARRIGPSRENRETEPGWRGVFERGIAAFQGAHASGRYEAMGAAVAGVHEGKSPRLDVVAGQLGALVAVAEALSLSPAPFPGAMPRPCDRDWTGDRIRRGAAFARTQAASVARALGAPDVAGLSQRADDHYAAAFACFVRLERFGRSDVQSGEVSGDGIVRAVRVCLPLVLDPPPSATQLDTDYSIGDQAIDCVIGDAGSLASCAGQVFAALAVVTPLGAAEGDEAARLCAAARKDTLK